MSAPEPTDDLLGVLHLASELAGRLHHAEVLPEHALMAMARDPVAAEALGSVGVDARRMEADLRDFLLNTAAPARAWHLLGPSYSPSLRMALERAVRRREIAGRDTLGVGDLLVSILREEVPSAVAVCERAPPRGAVYRESRHLMVHPVHRLQQSGFRLVDLLAWLSHGGRASEQAPVGAGGELDPVWVVLHNDDFTTFAFVQDVLRTEFGLDPPEANAVSHAVHAYGSETAGRFLRASAVASVRRATERARAEGFPLRITLEDRRHGDGPGPTT